jgi:hypothetical protein
MDSVVKCFRNINEIVIAEEITKEAKTLGKKYNVEIGSMAATASPGNGHGFFVVWVTFNLEDIEETPPSRLELLRDGIDI